MFGKLEQEKFARRLWDRDASLWKTDPEHQRAPLGIDGRDFTVPANVAHVEEGIELEKTLLIVSNKSSGTTETISFFKYFYDRPQKVKGDRAGESFIAITASDSRDLPIPGEPCIFSVLKQAQALGDLQSLQNKKRCVMRVDLGTDVKSGLVRLLKAFEGAVHRAPAASAS